MKSINKQWIVKTDAFAPTILRKEVVTMLPISGTQTQVVLKTADNKTLKVLLTDVLQHCEEVA